jgi:DNA-binding response OmpR family regulator
MINDKVILLVEDDANLNRLNRRALESDNYAVDAALNLAQARELLAKHTPDVILLDVKLPDGTGFNFCKEIREQGKYAAIPILFLTSVADQSGEMEGLEAGGTDYLRKPYSIELLRVRVANLLRLQESQLLRDVTRGPLTLNIKTMMAYLHGKDMGLKPKEFTLLLAFVENEGHVMSAEYIYKTVWEAPMADDPGALKYQISSLRSKIKDSGYAINSIYGKGYCFELER